MKHKKESGTDLLQTLLRLSTALLVRCRTVLLHLRLALVRGDMCRVARIAHVLLRPNKDERCLRAVVPDLHQPLLLHVVQRRLRGEGKGHKEHVGVGVRERSQPIVILLPRRVPQAKRDRLPVDLEGRVWEGGW